MNTEHEITRSCDIEAWCEAQLDRAYGGMMSDETNTCERDMMCDFEESPKNFKEIRHSVNKKHEIT